jgi:hypothetical protein
MNQDGRREEKVRCPEWKNCPVVCEHKPKHTQKIYCGGGVITQKGDSGTYHVTCPACIPVQPEEKCKRFNAVELDKQRTMITDIENTEPVCVIYSYYHPYVVDIILKLLNAKHNADESFKREQKWLSDPNTKKEYLEFIAEAMNNEE